MYAFGKIFRKSLDFFGDETEGMPILQIFLVKAKLYSYLKINMMSKQMGKGTPQSVVKQCSTHFQYAWCVLGTSDKSAVQHVEYNKLVSHRQQVYTRRLVRSMLSNTDTKRWQIDSVHSIPYGMKLEDLLEVEQGPDVGEAFLQWTDDNLADASLKRPAEEDAGGDVQSPKRVRF